MRSYFVNIFASNKGGIQGPFSTFRDLQNINTRKTKYQQCKRLLGNPTSIQGLFSTFTYLHNVKIHKREKLDPVGSTVRYEKQRWHPGAILDIQGFAKYKYTQDKVSTM